MKVVLTQAVNLGDIREIEIPPIGLAYLSAYVKANERGVEFAYGATAGEILSHKPDLVGISAVSQNSRLADELAHELRAYGYEGPLILGGYHITGLPGTLGRAFDAGVLGEGEHTLTEIVRLIRRKGTHWKEGLIGLKGTCFRQGPCVIVGQRRPNIVPLDKIPHPDRELLYGHWKPVYGGTQYVYSSRGCPFACSFCSSSNFWGGPRFFSASYVVDELVELRKRYRPAHFFFYDDLFVADRARLKEISDRVRALGLSDEVDFLCNVRAAEMDDEVLRCLKRMNVNWVYLGFESASDSVLSLMNKKASVESIVRALKMLKENGFSITASFMMGFPGETEEDMKKTALFIEENLGVLFDEFMLYPVIPFPGTKLWKEAVEKGALDENPSPESLRRATFSFHPDDYVYINESAPREVFLFYLYYLRFMRLRHWLKRTLDENHRLGLIMGDSVREIIALKEELERAAAYARKLDGELRDKESYIARLEEEVRSMGEALREKDRAGTGIHAPASRSLVRRAARAAARARR